MKEIDISPAAYDYGVMVSVRKLSIAGAAAIAVFSPPAFADVHWLAKEHTISAAPTDNRTTARYEFYVTGDTDVVLGPIRTSCDCTASATERLRYAPGETGAITARFDFGYRTGWQEKEITVVSTQGNIVTDHELTLRVFIPKSITVDSQIVWRRGEAATWKSTEIVVNRPEPVSMDVRDFSSKFTAVVETDADGRRGRLLIRPKDTSAATSSIVEILVQARGEDVETYPVTVVIE